MYHARSLGIYPRRQNVVLEVGVSQGWSQSGISASKFEPEAESGVKVTR